MSRIILDFARPTLLLTSTALTLSIAGGTLLGLIAVRKPHGRLDKGISSVALIAYSLPGFWLAQLCITYLVLRLRLFPLLGYSEFGSGAPTGLGHLVDVGRHLLLPMIVLAITEVAALFRVVRAGLLTEVGQNYMRTAEAKGLPREKTLSRHALRNVMLPTITLIGARIGFLLSGAAVVESIFSWPGMGSVLRGAARGNDRPLLLGSVLVISFTVMMANLITDLAYAWVDPRVHNE